MTTIFFHHSLFLLFLDPGSEIRDPRSGIRDPGWVKIRIRDKHLGFATLAATVPLQQCCVRDRRRSDWKS